MFFKLPAPELRDGPVPSAVAEIAQELVSELRDVTESNGWNVLSDWCLRRVPRTSGGDPAVRAALRHIVRSDGGARVPVIANVAGIGVRQLQRRFQNATGLTIKAYCRVRRLRTAMARQLASGEAISRTAAEGGYSDHAHLAREFSQLTGMAPTSVRRHLERIGHRNVSP